MRAKIDKKFLKKELLFDSNCKLYLDLDKHITDSDLAINFINSNTFYTLVIKYRKLTCYILKSYSRPVSPDFE